MKDDRLASFFEHLGERSTTSSFPQETPKLLYVTANLNPKP
jgi:hypothetical protein